MVVPSDQRLVGLVFPAPFKVLKSWLGLREVVVPVAACAASESANISNKATLAVGMTGLKAGDAH